MVVVIDPCAPRDVTESKPEYTLSCRVVPMPKYLLAMKVGIVEVPMVTVVPSSVIDESLTPAVPVAVRFKILFENASVWSYW